MAGKAAHLTQTVETRPSVFDFVAHEALNDLLHPAAKRIVDTLAHRYPTFTSVTKWFDEYFLLSHFLIQFCYLKKYRATFSEKFYGLKRIPLKQTKHNFLGNKELILSLIAVSLFPYLRSKLNKKCDEYTFDVLPRTTQKEKVKLLKSVIHFNNGFNIVYQLAKFVQLLKYLSGMTEINSPLLWAAGVKLKYVEENISEQHLTLRNFLPQMLQKTLELSAFFVQFMQWWQLEKSNSFSDVPVPPPPKRSEAGIKFSKICPICSKKRKIDTALSTSGFVFCFKCITSYLMEHNQCPVTKLPATVDNLIRIYPPS